MTKDATRESSPGGTKDMPVVREHDTLVLPIQDERDAMVRNVVAEVYNALRAKGYDPVNQIVGYLLSGDPGYITSYLSARSLIVKVDRHEILSVLVDSYLKEL